MGNFGIRLAECRRNKNFTQEELAETVCKQIERPDNFWIMNKN